MTQPDSTLRLSRLTPVDWIAITLFLMGTSFVLCGVLPTEDAKRIIDRILPLLIFLGAVIVLAELTANAEVFDVIACRIAIVAAGNYILLFLYCFIFAALTTIFLNLDTTAVLLTPVMIATARKTDLPGLPFAMTTLWLANTASLLLPVSNLTNLLAADRVAMTVSEFATSMAASQIAALSVTALFLWLFYWRPKRGEGYRYVIPERHIPTDRSLFTVAATACGFFITSVVLGVSLTVATPLCAGLVMVFSYLRKPGVVTTRLIPWRLLAFVTGLFLVIEAISQCHLGDILRNLLGQTDGSVLSATLIGAVASNVFNNLPAYVAGEAAIPNSNGDQLLGLLIGTNVGPLITPWASLATLLWYERCRANGLQIPVRRVMLTGVVTAALTSIAAAYGLTLDIG